MKHLTLLLFLFSLTTISYAQNETEINFPQDFFGIYKGVLEISSAGGEQTYPMEFHLLATDSIGKYKYTLIYGEGEQRQIRPYTLIEKDAKKGEYVVDENNGIVLDDKVVENRMYALFEVQGTLLTTFITFEKDHLIFEIVATQIEKKNISGGQNDSIPKVISYPISTVQRAILYKEKS